MKVEIHTELEEAIEAARAGSCVYCRMDNGAVSEARRRFVGEVSRGYVVFGMGQADVPGFFEVGAALGECPTPLYEVAGEECNAITGGRG